jgi:hypothetical protein
VSTIIPGGLIVTADEAAWLVRTLAERRLDDGQPVGLLTALRKAAAGASNPPRSTASVWLEFMRRRAAKDGIEVPTVARDWRASLANRGGPPPRSAFLDGQ